MAQKKLKRFNEIKSFPNVMEYPAGMQGKWNSHFKNNHPIVLELACGKGEYTVGLATLFPKKNFIGIDIKGNRIWAGAKKALDEKIVNAAFLRTQIDKISDYFAEGEIDSIWITFPDPQLRTSKASKRLTHPKFLRKYLAILRPGRKIHLKTDSPQLYNFTKLVAHMYDLHIHENIDNVYAQTEVPDELKIQTHYEGLDISGSNTIFYLSFSLPNSISEDDEQLHKILKEGV